MSTIPQLFPGLKYRDVRTKPFSAVLNAPLLGGFFTWANVLSPLQIATPSAIYFIDNITVKFDADQLVISNAIDQTFNPNAFSFDILAQDQTLLNLIPVTFAGFLDNRPLNMFYRLTRGAGYAAQNTNLVNLRINGRLNQTAELIALGKTSISMFLELDIYEIQNSAWIAENIDGRQ
jgi:hypothetical protein